MVVSRCIRLVACLWAVLFCFALGGCAQFDQAGSRSSFQNADSREKARVVFRHIDDTRSLPSSYPSRQERQQQYKDLQAEWNGVKGKYAKAAFSFDFFQTFPQDAEPVFTGLAAIKRRYAAGATARGFSSRVAEGSARSTRDTVTVPPFSVVEWNTKGNCLDPNLPAPRDGDSFQLVPVTSIITPELLPLYQCLMRQVRSDSGARRHQQQLVWAMRTVGMSRSYADSLGPQQLAVLDSCMPGGAAAFNRVRSRMASSAQFQSLMRDLVPVVSVAGISFNPVDLLSSDNPSGIVENELDRLIGMPVNELVRDDGYQYGTVAEGVHSYAVGTGPLALTVRLVNTNASPFIFDPTLYAAQAQRKTQRVTLAPPPSGSVKTTRLGGVNDTRQGAAEDKAFQQRMLKDIAGFWRSHAPKQTRESLDKGWAAGLGQGWLGPDPFVAAMEGLIALGSGKTLTGEDLAEADRLSLRAGFLLPFVRDGKALPSAPGMRAETIDAKTAIDRQKLNNLGGYRVEPDVTKGMADPQRKYRLLTDVNDGIIALSGNAGGSTVSPFVTDQIDAYTKQLRKLAKRSFWD